MKAKVTLALLLLSLAGIMAQQYPAGSTTPNVGSPIIGPPTGGTSPSGNSNMLKIDSTGSAFVSTADVTVAATNITVACIDANIQSCAANSTVELTLTGANSHAVFTLTGAGNQVVQADGTGDGTNWFKMYYLNNWASGNPSITTTYNNAGPVIIIVPGTGGLTKVRIRSSTVTSGTVTVSGRANSSSNSVIMAGTTSSTIAQIPLLTSVSGAIGVQITPSGALSDNLATATITGPSASGAGGLGVADLLFNGTGYDRQRNNLSSATVGVTCAGCTTTQTGADQINFNATGVICVLDMTTVGTGSVTLEIDAKDAVSAKYFSLLTGAAVTTNSTNVYTVHPGNTVTANVSASTVLPRDWRVKVTANNANATTYTVGCAPSL